jgi:hypothetical protein
MFWVISVYFNVRNTLSKSGTFFLGHPVYCIYIVCAVITAVSVPQKPISLSLRIFFIVWVWYSVVTSTVYQAYFIGLLVNTGFEKCITTVNEPIQSAIENGYSDEMDVVKFSVPLYKIIPANRKHVTPSISVYSVL